MSIINAQVHSLGQEVICYVSGARRQMFVYFLRNNLQQQYHGARKWCSSWQQDERLKHGWQVQNRELQWYKYRKNTNVYVSSVIFYAEDTEKHMYIHSGV